MVAERPDGKFAEARALQRAARIDVGEGRAGGDLEELGDGSVAIEADRHVPAVGADPFPHRATRIEAVERQEVHPSTVTLGDLADHILLALAVVFGAEPERDHQRAVEEVADADRAGGGDLAGGEARRVFRAGQRGAAAVVLVDVGVAFEGARRVGDGELRDRPARRLVFKPEDVFAAAGQGVDRGDRDQDEEGEPDQQRVAVGDRLDAAHAVTSSPAGSVSTARPRAFAEERRSTITRVAGRITTTPRSAAARSITVTAPKSRSMRMSEAIRTAKPAIAVRPEASTAAPGRSEARRGAGR